jgi:hypothetical protein
LDVAYLSAAIPLEMTSEVICQPFKNLSYVMTEIVAHLFSGSSGALKGTALGLSKGAMKMMEGSVGEVGSIFGLLCAMSSEVSHS